MDHLDEISRAVGLTGLMDSDRIALAGHSAGAGAISMIAGAKRAYFDSATTISDPRPKAFLALSPQGPGDEGFFESSWDSIDRPFFIGTGAGDTTSGTQEVNRRVPFMLMPEGNKYLLWLNHGGANHGLFNMNLEACVREVRDQDTCNALLTFLYSTSLAFLDAHLLDRLEAQSWLSSDLIEKASEGYAQFSKR
jgi:predicted dienelactone hydrolase